MRRIPGSSRRLSLPRPKGTREIVAHIMQRTYGRSTTVDAAIEDVVTFINTYEVDPHGRSFAQELTNRIWMWFSGGTTAANAAHHIIDAIGTESIQEAS